MRLPAVVAVYPALVRRIANVADAVRGWRVSRSRERTF